jgi:hypothetical protein
MCLLTIMSRFGLTRIERKRHFCWLSEHVWRSEGSGMTIINPESVPSCMILWYDNNKNAIIWAYNTDYWQRSRTVQACDARGSKLNNLKYDMIWYYDSNNKSIWATKELPPPSACQASHQQQWFLNTIVTTLRFYHYYHRWYGSSRVVSIIYYYYEPSLPLIINNLLHAAVKIDTVI